ncbi:Hint domain-containing protein [Roseobacter ponti]|uniref:Hedgehog/Intein (Hint) domain-containing protein n=1 Tax=Roseobacter ponti TaxID=1891787 RepID=A0A858SU74_9RHOB|nr:Hint domain-containing protein [Roseobacter ponti]QJF51528.1 hypothetical protein G3256_10320 [Roseobacter ponti]
MAPEGLTHGTAVLTLHGQIPVQHLRCGDQVITRRRGSAVVQSIEVISIVARVVYVIAGSLGHTCRNRDTLLSAGQPVLLRDWRAKAFGGAGEALVRAGDLADGEFVRDLGQLPVTLYRIRCGEPAVIYAGGMELGTADCLRAPRHRYSG